MRRLADRFNEAAAACSSLGDLRTLLGQIVGELGFDYFALLHHSSVVKAGNSFIRLDNYPADWVRELVSSGLAAEDPVHQASRKTNVGFLWDELSSLIRPVARQRFILQRSRHFGVGDGFTVPVNIPGEPSGSCSFVVRYGRELPQRHLVNAELIGAHAFRAARRLAPFPRNERPHLSRREVECLRLLACGKTDWEIAAILGIGVETARQYVKHARTVYDVVSRTQLAVLGVRDDWVSFDDVAHW